MGSEMSTQGFVRLIAEEHWASVSRVGRAEREQNSGRASAGRFCAHAGVDPTEVFCCIAYRIHKGQKRDSRGPEMLEAK
jgi:hypothetical protein